MNSDEIKTGMVGGSNPMLLIISFGKLFGFHVWRSACEPPESFYLFLPTSILWTNFPLSCWVKWIPKIFMAWWKKYFNILILAEMWHCTSGRIIFTFLSWSDITLNHSQLVQKRHWALDFISCMGVTPKEG